MAIEPRFPECTDCRFYSRRVVRKQCKACDSGEFFEEKDDPTDESRHSLTKLFGIDDER